MATKTELAKRIWEIFSVSKPALRKAYTEKGNNDTFSPFREEDADRAENMYNRFREIMSANENVETGYEKVLDYFEERRKTDNPDLLYYALKTFLVNDEGSVQFLIPSIFIREPELIIPSSSAKGTEVEIAVGSPEETKMDWFREDPSLNEHHGHWHIVYSNRRIRDRQGEMFFYMHQQMLARYDADRLGKGVARVQPFDNMVTNKIKVGYRYGDDVRLAGLIGGGREPGEKVSTAEGNEQRSNHQKVVADIDGGYYNPNDPFRMDEETRVVNALGSNVESNPQQDGSRDYLNYHGNGHVAIGSLNNGVMFFTEAAIRDVVFWEWHKGVDDLYYRLQQRFQPYDFSTDAPPVVFRKSIDAAGKGYSPDLILALKKDVLPGSFSSAQGQEIGSRAFNADKWNKDFGNGTFTYKDANGNDQSIKTVNTLPTRMKLGVIRYRDENNNPAEYEYPYLEHEPFCYFIRVENTSLQQKKVTVRIFLAPAVNSNDRRSWIEMDKFLHVLPPQSKHVIYRSDTEASVIRKPAVMDPGNDNINFDPTRIPIDDRQCNCGWPYHMLLPAGNESAEGMPYILMVMVTDAAIDMVGAEPDCGSLSFCGTRTNQYPDRRPLGYPFNRKFIGNGQTIASAITTNANMMCRTIQIKHTPL